MYKFSITKRFDNHVTVSERVRTVCRMFGVTLDRLNEGRALHRCDIEVEQGDIVYVTGPSGAGKSVLLREIEKAIPADERINIERIGLPANRAVIDCVGQAIDNTVASNGCGCAARIGCVKSQTSLIRNRTTIDETSIATERRKTQPASTMTTIEVLQLLGYAGLSDVFCILTAPANLSEGQQYRFRLACALASGKRVIFADEFCSSLDRITAAGVAYNVRRFVKRNKVTFFLASSHEDILADLQPDVLVVKRFNGEAEVAYKKLRT